MKRSLGEVLLYLRCNHSGLVFVENLDYFEINITTNESREGGYIQFKNFFNVPISNVDFYVDPELEGIVELVDNTIDSIFPDEIVKLYFDIDHLEKIRI